MISEKCEKRATLLGELNIHLVFKLGLEIYV